MLAGNLLFTKYKMRGNWFYKYYIQHFNNETVKHTAGFWTEEEYKYYVNHLGYVSENFFNLEEYE